MFNAEKNLKKAAAKLPKRIARQNKIRKIREDDENAKNIRKELFKVVDETQMKTLKPLCR